MKKYIKLKLLGIIIVLTSCIVEEAVLKYYSIEKMDINEDITMKNELYQKVEVELEASYYCYESYATDLHFIIDNKSKQSINFDSTSLEFDSENFEYEIYHVVPKHLRLLPNGKDEIIMGLKSSKKKSGYEAMQNEIMKVRLFGNTVDDERVLLFSGNLSP